VSRDDQQEVDHTVRRTDGAQTTGYVFVAPHLDDAVLSCGGLVSRLAGAGEDVAVVTVVTADPPEDAHLSHLAQRHHRGWDIGDAPFVLRCEEDVAAVDLLGARAHHLGRLDALYRQDDSGRSFYRRNICAVPVDPLDLEREKPLVRAALAQAMDELGLDGAHVFCPLTVGLHVDHVIVRRAVEELFPAHRITYYEDYPYAHRLETLHPRVVANGHGPSEQWQETTLELSADEIEARIAATACYSSQFPTLFPSTVSKARSVLREWLPGGHRVFRPARDGSSAQARMAAAVRAYVTRTGGERYWRVSPGGPW
jgi:LmbE family N-acetylglucosaminyl deacetylase